jgi:hypothetical protein
MVINVAFPPRKQFPSVTINDVGIRSADVFEIEIP